MPEYPLTRGPPRSFVLRRAQPGKGSTADLLDQQAVVAELWPAQAEHRRAQICVHAPALGSLSVPLVVLTALWLGRLHSSQQGRAPEPAAPSGGFFARHLPMRRSPAQGAPS